MSKGNQAFTPKARLIQILGEHLIKDASVGLLELAKNSYDADATDVEILMSGLNTPDGKIVIRDNGCGMSLDTFVNKWMNPASGHKQQQKERQERTQLGRLPLGEKGVGRFAAQQIGSQLKMISKTTDTVDLELYVEIDWRVFEDHTRDLADIRIDYESRPCQVFKHEKSGTILEISGLKSEWKEIDVKRVANSLKRMKSPFKGANDFNVRLRFENCPEGFYRHEDIEITDVLEKAHYKFYGLVDVGGVLDFEYDFQMPGFKKVRKVGQIDLKQHGDYTFNSKPKCGGFIVNYFVYDQTPKYLKLSGISGKDLKEFSGITIYRDGIRILPYGEKDNDWLKLDYRRIQNPGKRISKDQIIGMVEVNQIENLLLKDKTNREGLIENEEYSQFEQLVLSTITVMEHEILPEREEKRQKERDLKKEIETGINDIQSKLSDAAEKISKENADSSITDDIKAAKSTVIEVKKQVEQTVDDYEKNNKTLFHLAGTGLAAERFTHEFARLVSGANMALVRLVKLIDIDNPKIKKEVDTIRGALEALRNDIRLLGPMFYIKKVANEKELGVKQIIENTISLHEHWLKEESIEVEMIGNSFNVIMREGSCMQIFSNLIDNAIFWLSRKSELDKRKIKVIIDAGRNTVYISDSGPGVVARYKDKIFDPFFSMKGEEGRGLGLYIVKEILDEKNWGIFLINQDDFPGLLKGASFKVVFGNDNE